MSGTGTPGFQGPPGGGNIEAVKRILVWLILAAALVTGFLFYHFRQSRLDVTPDALQQIDKAKGR
jgi:hypothetical protein